MNARFFVAVLHVHISLTHSFKRNIFGDTSGFSRNLFGYKSNSLGWDKPTFVGTMVEQSRNVGWLDGAGKRTRFGNSQPVPILTGLLQRQNDDLSFESRDSEGGFTRKTVEEKRKVKRPGRISIKPSKSLPPVPLMNPATSILPNANTATPSPSFAAASNSTTRKTTTKSGELGSTDGYPIVTVPLPSARSRVSTTNHTSSDTDRIKTATTVLLVNETSNTLTPLYYSDTPKYLDSYRYNETYISVTGLCGYPPYSNRVACRNQGYFTDSLSKCEEEWRNVFGILVGIVAAAIICVNALIPAIFTKNHDMRTHYNMIKVSLAFADVILGILVFATVLPNMAWIRDLTEEEIVIFAREDANSPTAIIVGSFLTVSLQASILHLCFLSIERFIAIKWSLWHIQRKTRSIVNTLVCLWIGSITAGFVPAFFPQYFEYKFQPVLLIHMLTMKPRPGTEKVGYQGIVYIFTVVVLPYIVTVSVCILTGVVSCTTLRSTARYFEKVHSSVSTKLEIHKIGETNAVRQHGRKILQPEIAVFVTIVIMICAFTLTLLPFAVVVTLVVTEVLDCGNYTIPYTTAFYFALLNSLSNGIIYSLKDARFRHAVKELFRKESSKSSNAFSNTPLNSSRV